SAAASSEGGSEAAMAMGAARSGGRRERSISVLGGWSVRRRNRLDLEADVYRSSRMSERTHGYKVSTRFGQHWDSLEADTAGHLNVRAAIHPSDSRANLGVAHVVDQDGFGSPGERLVDLLQALRFDLDRQTRPECSRALDCGLDTTGQTNVIVLDENPVE